MRFEKMSRESQRVGADNFFTRFEYAFFIVSSALLRQKIMRVAALVDKDFLVHIQNLFFAIL